MWASKPGTIRWYLTTVLSSRQQTIRNRNWVYTLIITGSRECMLTSFQKLPKLGKISGYDWLIIEYVNLDDLNNQLQNQTKQSCRPALSHFRRQLSLSLILNTESGPGFWVISCHEWNLSCNTASEYSVFVDVSRWIILMKSSHWVMRHRIQIFPMQL